MFDNEELTRLLEAVSEPVRMQNEVLDQYS